MEQEARAPSLATTGEEDIDTEGTDADAEAKSEARRKRDVIAGIQRIHDTAATHARYETLLSPVDGQLISKKFDANHVEVMQQTCV